MRTRPTRRVPSRRDPTRRLARLASLALLVAIASLGAGCQTVVQLPATLVIPDVAYADLFTVVERTIDGEGFPVRLRDRQTGTIESHWRYGTSLREHRGPSRQRVVAAIEEGAGGWVLKLRVLEEVVRKGGLLATNPRETEDWEPIPDNFDAAETLVARINATLRYGS